MFPHTVTIYNKYKDNGVEKWQRTVLKGVFWNSIKGAIMRKTGVVSADSVQLIIPMRDGYAPPKQWQLGKWTLKDGDTIVKGGISYEVVRSSKELEQFDDCLIITSVDTKDFGGSMANFEVNAK